MKILVCLLAILMTIFIYGCKILPPLPDLGNGYYMDYDPVSDRSILKILREGDAPTYFIDGHILSYAVDSTFVIVEQRPRDSVPECTGKIPGMTKPRCDEAFEKSTFSQYWIINKKEKPEFNESTYIYSNVYGPYTKAEYIQAREKLGVPKGLQLKKL